MTKIPDHRNKLQTASTLRPLTEPWSVATTKGWMPSSNTSRTTNMKKWTQSQFTMQTTNYSSHSRTMTNLVIGLTRVVHLVLTSALRTKPFLSGNAACTLPRGHDPLGALGSTAKTTSPTWTLRSGNNHFWRSCRRGKYSRIHLFQKRSLMCWTWRQQHRT